MARIVVGAPLDLSRSHGQQRLGPVQRLDLALLVDAQNQGALRRGQIKPDDVAHLVDKQWVGGKLEGLGAMRLKVERLPNAMDGRGRKSDRARHRAQAPMRRIPRRRIQRQANRLGDLVIADPARRAGARLVEEAIEAMLGEPAPPFAHRVGGCVDAQADVLVLRAFRGQKDDAGPLRQPLRSLSPRRQTLKLTPLPLRQIDRYRRLPHREFSAESIRKENRTYLPITTLEQIAISRIGRYRRGR